MHLSVIELSVHRTVGREDLLSVCGVHPQPRTTGTIQPSVRAARGISAEIAADPLVAPSAFRHVVGLLVVVNVGQDDRDLMNAGKALPRLAKFESASQTAERVRPPMRGTEGADGAVPAASASPARS